ncbi:MAG: winged helix DNA-binding domain-containing protein [Pseudomonadota bacterium]
MDLSQRRLRNQYIDGCRFETPEEVVRALGAIQAQDYYSALWAIGLRLRSPCEAKVEQAIVERRIVRTWPMRGTLHFVAAEDVRWLTELLTPRILQRNGARLLREFGIDRPLIKRASKILKTALSGAGALTRAALYEQLNARGITTDRQRGMHILWWLAHEGLICCGLMAGKQHTFVLLDEWVPAPSSVKREEALALLARRYFAHHGPATPADFVWWSGLTVADANVAIEGARSHLSDEENNNTTWWSGKSAPRRTHRSAPCQLLPVYDEFTVGYADRSAALDPVHARHVAAGHGIFRAPIVIEGRIVGSWRREIRKDRIDIGVVPLTRFNREQLQRIQVAAQRYGKFLGLAAKVKQLAP